MSKKLYFLISFVLVLSLAGNVLAYETLIWDNDKGDGDQLWRTASNWDWNKGGPSRPGRAPIASDWVVIQDWAGTDPCNHPIINADTNAVCEWLDLGFNKVPLNEVVLTMTGGTIKGCSWMSTGYYYGGTYRFDMSGGTIDLGAYGFTLGWASGGYNTFNMSGGTFNCEDFLSIGTWRGDGDMNMTGGDVNLAGWFQIGCADTNLGTGHVDLHGGTVETALLAMGGGGVGTMDFAGGTLIIEGDYRLSNDWLFDPCSDEPNDNSPPLYTGTIAILTKRGLITAYGTKVGEIIASGDNVDLRAVINLDYDVTNRGQTTLTGGAVDPNLAWDPDPLFGSGGLRATDVNRISWAAGDNADTHEVYFGTSYDDVNDANTSIALGVYEGNQPLADVNFPVSVTWGTTYYWRIDEVNDPTTWTGTVWNFATKPGWATNPRPKDGATGVSPLSLVIMWDPGPEANDVKGHHVYFSTDFNDVNDRVPNFLAEILDTNNYTPSIELAKKYYWAVDEVNRNEDPNIWPGEVWNFKIANRLVVDNFESYVNTGTLNDTWHDWTDPDAKQGSGQDHAEVIHQTTIVHGGSSSMEYRYDNVVSGAGDKERFSEAWAYASDPCLTAGTDWTVAGAEVLVLYFYGDPCNSADPVYDQMWVGLEDGSDTFALVHCNDMNDVDEPWWHEWNIILQDFNDGGVDLSDVDKIYIGFGVRAAQGVDGTVGKVYFDNIRLYPPRCRTGLVVADITGDCITNLADVDIMGRDWLMFDYNVPEAPISGAPVGWWKLDEGSGTTAYDSAGSNHGTIYNEDWVVGYPNDPCDSALHFDGDGMADYDRVECAVRTGDQPGDYPDELMPATFTVACWVKVEDFCDYDGLVVNADDYGEFGLNSSGFYLYAGYGGTKSFGLGIRTEDAIYWLDTPDTYETDTWYHLAATYNDTNTANIYDGKLVLTDANTANIYVDGKLVRSDDVGGPIRWINQAGDFPKYFMIGALHDYEVLDWFRARATIDDVRVYDYAMPYGEIVTLAEQGPVVYHDVNSPANIYDLEAKLSKIVNFRDYVILADHWLEGPILWPPQ